MDSIYRRVLGFYSEVRQKSHPLAPEIGEKYSDIAKPHSNTMLKPNLASDLRRKSNDHFVGREIQKKNIPSSPNIQKIYGDILGLSIRKT